MCHRYHWLYQQTQYMNDLTPIPLSCDQLPVTYLNVQEPWSEFPYMPPQDKEFKFKQ